MYLWSEDSEDDGRQVNKIFPGSFKKMFLRGKIYK